MERRSSLIGRWWKPFVHYFNTPSLGTRDKFQMKENSTPQLTVVLPAREEDEAVEVPPQIDKEAENGGGENKDGDDDVVEVPPTEAATSSTPSSLPLALTRERRTPRPNTKYTDYATMAIGDPLTAPLRPPASDVAPARGVAPASDVAPTRGIAPAHGVAPARGVAPAHGVAPACGVAPARRVAPACPAPHPLPVSTRAALPSRAAQPSRVAQPSRAAPTTPSSTAFHGPAAIASTAATAPTAAMASPTVLTFDAEGRAIDFDVWVDDLQLFLQCYSRDGVSLFDHTSGVSTAPAATADSTVRSQWTTRDAAARLAVRSHLPPAKRAHFGQHKTAQSLYDTVVARYSSPATATLSRLMLPYLFLDLAAFATVADLVAHLRTSDARYRAALPT
ncbi:unnamed protein product, partial [Closterium sp. NIES-54]